MNINQLSSKIIGAAIEVHKILGTGLVESAYEKCLCHELSSRGLSFEKQKTLSIDYKGRKIDRGYRLDVVVENAIILELKSCETIESIHKAQLLTYLKLTGLNLGLILNFNVPLCEVASLELQMSLRNSPESLNLFVFRPLSGKQRK